MPDYFNTFMPSCNKTPYILKHAWPVVPPGTKELKKLNICETKNCKIKVGEQDLEKWKNCGKIANEQIFIAFTLFIYGLYFALA